MHVDQFEEIGYAERCDETMRQILREEHHDPYAYEFPTAEEMRRRAEDEELTERYGLEEVR